METSCVLQMVEVLLLDLFPGRGYFLEAFLAGNSIFKVFWYVLKPVVSHSAGHPHHLAVSMSWGNISDLKTTCSPFCHAHSNNYKFLYKEISATP